MSYTSYLEKLPFWPRLSDDERQMLNDHCRGRDFSADAVLHGQGDTCLGLVYVVSGGLRASLLSEEGREITLFRVAAGDFCVLSAACVLQQITFETLITTETATEVLIVNAAAIEGLKDGNIYVRSFLYEKMAERFSEVMWTMQQILFMGFDRRLALFLTKEAAGESCLRLTHEQIAAYTGSAREVVTRMLKRFADEGWVRLSRGRVEICDAAALKALADGDF